MTDKRWTLDPEIEAFMAGFVPPQDVIDRLTHERTPIEAAAPKPGDRAPDFAAEELTASGERSTRRLADMRGRPVALLFGSYTCPIYRGQTDRLNEIYTELRDDFDFLTIYTREAHPEDGWQVGINHAQGVVYDQPTDLDDRAAIARTCRDRHRIEMPIALDDMDDSIEKAYSGSPERLYLIDAAGIVRYRSARGPFNLAAIEDWYRALTDHAANDGSEQKEPAEAG